MNIRTDNSKISGFTAIWGKSHDKSQDILGFPSGSDSKESTCNVGKLDSTPGREDPLEKGMATHSIGILAWRIPWTEKLGGLQSMELQRVRQD